MQTIAEFTNDEIPIFCEFCNTFSNEYQIVDDRCICIECADEHEEL